MNVHCVHVARGRCASKDISRTNGRKTQHIFWRKTKKNSENEIFCVIGLLVMLALFWAGEKRRRSGCHCKFESLIFKHFITGWHNRRLVISPLRYKNKCAAVVKMARMQSKSVTEDVKKKKNSQSICAMCTIKSILLTESIAFLAVRWRNRPIVFWCSWSTSKFLEMP